MEHEIPYPEVVFKRRSKRNFMDRSLSDLRFQRLMHLICDAANQDVPEGFRCTPATGIGILAGNIETVAPGFYLLDPSLGRIGRVSKTDMVRHMASVCLDQEWLKYASLHVLFLANLIDIDRVWGPRGYRYAMMNAGRLGQILYLGATASGMGACGIGALYDREAQTLLGLNADSALLYLVAAGVVSKPVEDPA